MKDAAFKGVGYAHHRYAESLREYGEPRELPHSGGWILERPIPGTPFKDAMGCYPLFACRDWTRLSDDMKQVSSDLVSLVFVAEPFAEIPSGLKEYFDLVTPFKTHYVADLSYPLERFVSRSHRNEARNSLKIMDIEICHKPAKYLDDWVLLYDNLITRHNISGISAFSYKSFEIQMETPGMIMALGRFGGKIVGATLALVRGNVAYAHLSAYSKRGYKINASCGILWRLFTYLRQQGVRYFDNGGAAGIKDDQRSGLAHFKRGWSNDRRTVYLYGRVMNRDTYELLCRRNNIAGTDYFPAYRSR